MTLYSLLWKRGFEFPLRSGCSVLIKIILFGARNLLFAFVSNSKIITKELSQILSMFNNKQKLLYKTFKWLLCSHFEITCCTCHTYVIKIETFTIIQSNYSNISPNVPTPLLGKNYRTKCRLPSVYLTGKVFN